MSGSKKGKDKPEEVEGSVNDVLDRLFGNLAKLTPISSDPEQNDWNREETEEDGIRAGALRREKIRRLTMPKVHQSSKFRLSGAADNTTKMSREKINTYMAINYLVGDGGDQFTLRIGQHSPSLTEHYRSKSTISCSFISAFSPYGVMCSDSENEKAHQALGAELRQLSSFILEGAVADPEGRWPPERSFLAFGINEDTAAKLGERYRQDAVVWTGQDAVPRLLLLR